MSFQPGQVIEYCSDEAEGVSRMKQFQSLGRLDAPIYLGHPNNEVMWFLQAQWPELYASGESEVNAFIARQGLMQVVV